MPRRLMLLALLCLVAGCGSPGARLIGQWKCDVLAEAAAAMPAPVKPTAGVLGALGMKMDIHMDFRADGTVTVSADSNPLPGLSQGVALWEVVRAEKDLLTLNLRYSKDDRPTQVIITLIDNDRFNLGSAASPQGPKLTFHRVKAE